MSKQPLDSNDQGDGKKQPSKSTPPESRTVPEVGPTFAAAQPAVQDLSKEIVQSVSKAVGERVTCRRIFGDHYRCNWWTAQGTGEYDNPTMTGMMVTTHRVSRSEMLRVTKTAEGLTIVTAAGGKR